MGQFAIYASAPVWAVLLIPFYFLPRRLAARALKAWAASALWQIRVLGGIRIEERGRENLPAGACLLASKHQSALDTFAFAALLEEPAIVHKRELMWIPVFGWMLWKADMIPVDRRGGRRALKAMLGAARTRAGEGRPILIFPEGTRTRPGERRPFQSGLAALYGELGVPLVPVALNSGLFWPRRSFRKNPGVMVIEYLPPIAPGLPRAQMMAEVEQRVHEASERLLAEGRRFLRG
ncbi:MAG: 1-acyl-sn-glycerol-3-phosphate acyltransferase [Alphaproteobacteria bacterium]|nr:1-acyl-sn-glycerol-3-phosphate acyltransferase [Alphaproteobacteria bacterium]